jgi:two-component system, OmpR family, phosphate regulon sensor histidine kinase PhoR
MSWEFWLGLVLGAGAVALAWRHAKRAAARPVGALPLERVLDALEEGVMVVGADGLVRLANARCATLLAAAGPLPGCPLVEVARRPELAGLVQRCLERGPQPPMILNGGPVVWRIEAVPVAGDGGEPLACLVLRDETDRARTEQIRREFVANASHELRTPLTIVQGYLENLLDGALEHPELARKFLKTARKHTERLTRLVEDMLSVSRLESGEAGLLKNKPFSLVKCFDRVADHLHALMDQRGAKLEISIDPAVQRLRGDRFYWEQVFFNLVENSLKNNQKQGLLVRLEARATADGGAEMSVCDDGIGIPAEALPFIFNRFYRVQHAGAADVPGTGLGLSIVKRAVEAHDGTVEVMSEPGSRTCFRIRLPAARVAREEPSAGGE